ncbi:MAG: hypothetical protein Q9191_002734 [Dirinaria sp. TL-2023a]
MDTMIHDVLIIGAGPAGLAVAARLREPTPSSIFTDAEHDRYQWIKRHSGRMNLRPRARDAQKSKCNAASFHRDTIDIKVLDSSGANWLNSWKKNFETLDISHLRSPMFFHPCPHDRDGLLAYAHKTDRYGDCVEIANCVHKSMSKHRRKKKVARGQSVGSSSKAVLEIDERDRKDYFTPSSELFHDYCDGVVHQYSLENLVEQSQVVSIDFGFFDDSNNGDPEKRVFKVVTGSGSVQFAKIVVLAIGAGGEPIMPRHLSTAEREGACHSAHLPKQAFLARSVRQKILTRQSTVVVIVGGGLTAAQLANKCIQDGVSRVFMIMRSALKRKWSITLHRENGSCLLNAKRLEILLKARNGGSIPPLFFKKLQAHIARGALSIHTETIISNQTWAADRKTWNIETEPTIPGFPSQVDYVYYATGARPDIEHLPFLSKIRQNVPIKVIGGMPCLTEDLAWASDVPLYVSGKLAGLRIGPDCGNLEGARVGAERISWAVNERMERQKGKITDEEDPLDAIYQRIGSVNMYESLEMRGSL